MLSLSSMDVQCRHWHKWCHCHKWITIVVIVVDCIISSIGAIGFRIVYSSERVVLSGLAMPMSISQRTGVLIVDCVLSSSDSSGTIIMDPLASMDVDTGTHGDKWMFLWPHSGATLVPNAQFTTLSDPFTNLGSPNQVLLQLLRGRMREGLWSEQNLGTGAA